MPQELETVQKVIDVSSELIVKYGFQIVGAIIILLIGWQISRWVAGLILKVCARANLDTTLSKFFSSVAKTLVLVFVVIIALGKFGITIAPFIAALGAIAFGGTLALQGLLSNYAAGLTIILTRPFVVGDTIKIQGVIGVVEEIKLGYTMLSTEDGEMVMIPNKQIVGEILHNSKANMVVEATVGIDYQSDPERAISIIRQILEDNVNVVKLPEPQVGIASFGESAITIGYRYWVPSKQYYQTLYTINQAVHKSLIESGVVIPFPQRDVHIIEKSG